MNKKYIVLIGLFCVIWLAGSVFAQTEDEVGDIDSFKREARFSGYAVSGGVVVVADCTTLPFPLGPDDRCVPINATTSGAGFDVRDIGRIRFPPKTFETVIYMMSRHQISYSLTNFSTITKGGRLQYVPSVTLVSSILEDPSLINPQTGLPFAGKMDVALAGSRTLVKTLFPNYQERDSITFGSPSISGINKRFLRDAYNLPASVVDDIFRKELTILLNIRGQTLNAESAAFNYSIRFLGN